MHAYNLHDEEIDHVNAMRDLPAKEVHMIYRLARNLGLRAECATELPDKVVNIRPAKPVSP